jgi:hypothetical protein
MLRTTSCRSATTRSPPGHPRNDEEDPERASVNSANVGLERSEDESLPNDGMATSWPLLPCTTSRPLVRPVTSTPGPWRGLPFP